MAKKITRKMKSMDGNEAAAHASYAFTEVAAEDRPKVGQWVNETRSAIEEILAAKLAKLEEEALKLRYEKEKIDVTMPAEISST